MDVISSPINGFCIFLAGCKATTLLSRVVAVAMDRFSSLRGTFSTWSSCVHMCMSCSLPRACRQRRKLGRHLCTSWRPDGLCGVRGRLRRPRGGLGCIGAGEWTCGCGGQAAHTSSRDITKLRKYIKKVPDFFFPGPLTCVHVHQCGPNGSFLHLKPPLPPK